MADEPATALCYRPAPMSPARKKTTTKKTASKRTSVRKPAARKGHKKGAKKAATRKVVAKQTAAKKTPRSSAKKTGSKRTPAPKAGVKKPAKKTVTKAPARKTPKKATARKQVATAPAPKTPIRKLPQRPTSRPARPVNFDKETLAKIRAQLDAERADLAQQETELEENSFEGTQSDLTGEVGLDEDFADAGTATFDRERDLSIRNNIRDLIEQITRAIRKIDEGTYGTCENCGNPIDAQRIRALPHALLCLDCKRREERTR
jgi:RNA polymerase-binding protein DksA